MLQCVTAASGSDASYRFLVTHQSDLTCCTLALPKVVTRRLCLPAQNNLHRLIANKMCELQRVCREDLVLEHNYRTNQHQYIYSKTAVQSRQAVVVYTTVSGPVDLHLHETQPGNLLCDMTDA